MSNNNTLRDMASWALGLNNNNNTEEEEDNNNVHQNQELNESEMRQRRLDRLNNLAAAGSRADVVMANTDDNDDTAADASNNNLNMDDDLPPNNNINKADDVSSKESIENTKLVSKMKSSPHNNNNKTKDRKKYLLIQNVLHVNLNSTGGASSSSSSSSTTVSIPLEELGLESLDQLTSSAVDVLLATRLSVSVSSSSSSQNNNSNVGIGVAIKRLGVIGYLSGCFTRCVDELKKNSRMMTHTTHTSETVELLTEIKQQIIAYAASSLMTPDLFELGADGIALLINLLAEGLVWGKESFWSLLCEELESQKGLYPVVQQISDDVCQKLRQFSTVMDPNFSIATVNILSNLCTHKKAAFYLTQVPNFLLPPADSPEATVTIENPNLIQMPPGVSLQQQQFFRMMMRGSASYQKRSGPGVERETVLGLVLRLGLKPDSSSLASAFSNPASRTMNEMKRASSNARQQLHTHYEACHSLVKGLIMSGATGRGRVMKWIEDCLLLNVGATAMRPDKQKVSSAQTLVNLSVVLLKLCEPFLDSEKKVHLIDYGFVCNKSAHGGLFVSSGDNAVPRLGENTSSADNCVQNYKPSNTFIPTCFFLTARALYLGVISLSSHHWNIVRQVNHTAYSLRQRNGDPRTDGQFNHLLSYQLANEATISDPSLMTDSISFFNTMSLFLLGLEKEQLGLMPEHFIENICDILDFISKMEVSDLHKVELGNIFKLTIKLLSPEYSQLVRNYNLRAKLGDILYDVYLPGDATDDKHHDEIFPGAPCDPTNGMSPYLLSDTSAQATLAPSLLLLYGEVEHTGYHEKMFHRAHIASLIKYLWESKEHRPAFAKITADKQSFIKFANGIMNETNALISNVMEKLFEIRQVQMQMANHAEWAAIAEEERETISGRHSDNEQEVKRALPLCNKTLQMLGYLNDDDDIKRLFLSEEMCGRLCNMLLHVLTKLIGSKGLDLKVDNPESYNFKPKEILRGICYVFSTFASSPEFQKECARSGYFNMDLITKNEKTCQKLNLLPQDRMEKLSCFTINVSETLQSIQDDDALTEDAPDHFMDPLMCTFMKDPVYLPTSNNIVDRSTIMQHLLNDPHDPFNRKPLTMDDIKPASELKAEIDEWLQAKRVSMMSD